MKTKVKDSGRPFRKCGFDIFNFLFPLLVPSRVPVASSLLTRRARNATSHRAKPCWQLVAGVFSFHLPFKKAKHANISSTDELTGKTYENNEMGQGFKMLQNVLVFLL